MAVSNFVPSMPSPIDGHSRTYLAMLFLMLGVIIGLTILVQATTPKSGVVPRTTHTFPPTTTSTTEPTTTTWYPTTTVTTTTTVPPTTTTVTTTVTTATTTTPPPTTTHTTTTTHATTTATTTTATTTATTTVPPTTLPSCSIATQIGQTLSGSTFALQDSSLVVNLQTGSVAGYLFNGSYWVQQGASFGSGSTPFNVDIDSGTIAVSNQAGNVTMYTFNGSTWTPKGQSIIVSTRGTLTQLSLGDLGNTVAIGNSYDQFVKIYDYTSGSWVQRGGTIQPAGASNIGQQVSISSDGTTVMFSSNSGLTTFVRMFRWVNPVWIQIGQLLTITNGVVALDISETGNSIIIGNSAGATGSIAMYAYDGTSWIQRGSTVMFAGTSFGSSVSMSASGNTVASTSQGTQSIPPFTRIYDDLGGTWTQRGTPILGDQTGCSLSSEGSRVATGVQSPNAFMPFPVMVYCI